MPHGRLAGAGALLVRDPRGFAEVALDQAERALEPLRAGPRMPARPLDEILGDAGDAIGGEVRQHLAEEAASEIEAHVRAGVERLGRRAPFPVAHNAAPSLAKLCYALCRALRPALVVETGVAYGVSSAFITKALAVNGHGELHSIDRASVRPGSSDHVGALVPGELRDRWVLHHGRSRRLLPGLLAELGQVGLFVHDSWHTYRTVAWELRTVTPRLARPGAVLVDDVAGNRAFEHWASRSRPRLAAIVEEEPVGVAVFSKQVSGPV